MAYNDKGSSNFTRGGGTGGRSFNQGGGRPQQDNRSSFQQATFPDGYLKNAYLTDDGKDDVRYITKYAQHIGKCLCMDSSTGKSKIRSYFDSVTAIKEAFYTGKITKEKAIIQLSQLEPRVYDRMSKGNASKYFVDFINKNVDTVIEDPDLFKERLLHFCNHFEAVVCYTAEKTDRR